VCRPMSGVAELFGRSAEEPGQIWKTIIRQQQCPFLGKRCYKVRKSDPSISIGTCTVLYGRIAAPIIICPARLIECRQIFVDCLHLLTTHEPGNELHIIGEVSVPGGSVDYFLVSAREGRVRDFVGIAWCSARRQGRGFEQDLRHELENDGENDTCSDASQNSDF
jgi:hypothetical protein